MLNVYGSDAVVREDWGVEKTPPKSGSTDTVSFISIDAPVIGMETLHSCVTFLCYILVLHSCVTLLCYILVLHFCVTLKFVPRL